MKAWIRLTVALVIRLILKILYIFKIKRNRIVANSYNGKQYSCNPKYIIEYLLKSDCKYEIIFGVNDLKKFKFLEDKGIHIVRFWSLKFWFYSLTSKIFISNGIAPVYLPFRKKQFVLATWHGGGAYKKGGLDTIKNKQAYLLRHLQSNIVTGVISSCASFTEIFHKSYLIPYYKFLEFGMPRNDILLNGDKKEIHNKICKIYNLKNDTKILLYAPTFRSKFGSMESGWYEGDYNINFSKLDIYLKEKFKGNWTIFFRAHYYLKGVKNKSYIDVTDYPDMQELLCAADILITDYSSCMWDFSLMYKPCFIYATDIDQYKQDRDFYTPMSEWPFPIATNTDELISNIVNFNEKEYIEKVKKHHQALGSYEDGHACERVCKLIEDIIDGKVQKQ